MELAVRCLLCKAERGEDLTSTLLDKNFDLWTWKRFLKVLVEATWVRRLVFARRFPWTSLDKRQRLSIQDRVKALLEIYLTHPKCPLEELVLTATNFDSGPSLWRAIRTGAPKLVRLSYETWDEFEETAPCRLEHLEVYGLDYIGVDKFVEFLRNNPQMETAKFPYLSFGDFESWRAITQHERLRWLGGLFVFKRITGVPVDEWARICRILFSHSGPGIQTLVNPEETASFFEAASIARATSLQWNSRTINAENDAAFVLPKDDQCDLTNLESFSWKSFDAEDLPRLETRLIEFVRGIVRGPKITRLKLPNWMPGLERVSVLRRLDLSSLTFVPEFAQVLAQLHNLEKLSLAFTPRLAVEELELVLQVVATNLSKLEHLHVKIAFAHREVGNRIFAALGRTKVPKLTISTFCAIPAERAETFASELARNDRIRSLKVQLMNSPADQTKEFCLAVLLSGRENARMQRMRFAANPLFKDLVPLDVSSKVQEALRNGGWPELRLLEQGMISASRKCQRSFDWSCHPKLARNDFFYPNVEPDRYARWVHLPQDTLTKLCWRTLPFQTKTQLNHLLAQ